MRAAISRYALETILEAARDSHPAEACGILFGDPCRIEEARPAPNVAADPKRHFEIDPAALIAALREERRGGPRVVGWFHSHPSGSPLPSATDAGMAAPDGRLWLIAAAGMVRAWRAVARGALHDRFDPVELAVEPGQPSLAEGAGNRQ